MRISCAEYAVKFFIEKDITDIFGYPGGFITHFIDMIKKSENTIKVHICYNEQGAAFAANAYARITGKPGVCFSTSGPGAFNLLSGIADAWFDSVPIIALTGQVNTHEQRNDRPMRQKGFQEVDIVRICESITKYAVAVTDPERFADELNFAYNSTVTGRHGPAVIDFPMDVQRSLIDPDLKTKTPPDDIPFFDTEIVYQTLKNASNPVIIAGAGVRKSNAVRELGQFAEINNIPIVTSMISVDLIPRSSGINFGFIGIYGNRIANTILLHADVVLTLGTRLDSRQTGSDLRYFAPNAKLIRVDIDKNEFSNKIKNDELQVNANLKDFLAAISEMEFGFSSKWIKKCRTAKSLLENFDQEIGNEWCEAISDLLPQEAVLTLDVGQNQVWAAQTIDSKGGRLLFSGGFGAMGFSLPAAMGASIALGKKTVFSISGDGGIQMNIQELAAVKHLPIKIMVFNNKSLGMIRVFQTELFDSRFMMTTESSGYSAPDFVEIAKAYGIKAAYVCSPKSLCDYAEWFLDDDAMLLSLEMEEGTVISPKLLFGTAKQSPPLPDHVIDELNSIFCTEVSKS